MRCGGLTICKVTKATERTCPKSCTFGGISDKITVLDGFVTFAVGSELAAIARYSGGGADASTSENSKFR